MLYLSNVLWGFALTAAGMTLPGMVNMTALNVSIKNGFGAAVKFSLGSLLALMVQAYVAITFARYLGEHPGVLKIFKQTAVIIFFGLSLTFFLMAIRPKAWKTNNTDKQPFLFGVVVMSMNMLNIPYLFASGTLLEAKGWINLTPSSKWYFISGATLGGFTILILYAWFADYITSHARFFARHMNLFLSALFMLLAVVQMIQLYY